MRAASAFIIRDLRAAWSYRFSFVVQNASMLFSLLSLRFISDLFSTTAPNSLEQYGGDYFSFVLLGAALSVLSYPVTKTFAGAVRSAQVTGTFEAMLTTRANPAVIILSAGIYPVLMASLQLVLFITAGMLLLGAGLHLGNAGLALAVLVMTITSLAGVGLISAAFVIAFKQNEPFTGAMLAASFMLSGILYPTSVLPSWLGYLAPLLPVTHAIELTRGLLIEGAATGSLAMHFLALAAFSLLLPAGIALLSVALNQAKRSGSLAHY